MSKVRLRAGDAGAGGIIVRAANLTREADPLLR